MNDMNSVLKRLVAIEDELIRLRKQRNYELNNLDETNIPRLREYSETISENKAAVTLVEQKVTDVESSVTILSQYTAMDNVVAVESSEDKSAWDKSKVYYDSVLKTYFYYDGTAWKETTNPVTAGLDTSIAKIEARTTKNESEISSVAKNVSTNTSNIASVKQTADTNKSNITSLVTSVNKNSTNIAAVTQTANATEANVSTIVTNIGSNGTVNAASIVAKINAAGSSVQIAADHISLAGKTIALTSDSIDIASTYFNVSTAGAVNCTSLDVSGANSNINIGGSGAESVLVKLYNGGNDDDFVELSPAGIYVKDRFNNGVGELIRGSLMLSGSPYGYHRYIELSSASILCYNGFSGSNFFQVIPSANSGTADQVICAANFVCAGAKNRLERTEHYGNRLMYAYETPAPMYADFGRGTIAEDGMCVVYLDPLFYECVDNVYEYFVFLQREGGGEIEVTKRLPDRFTVTGAPGATFAWMLTAPQKGFVMTRCEEFFEPETEPPQIPNPENAVYDKIGDTILKDYENQLG